LLYFLLIFAWFPSLCGAITVVLDLAPTTPGVQNTVAVTAGESFDVNVLIANIAPNVMQGFEFELEFDTPVGATGVVAGAFLNGTFGTFIGTSNLVPPTVDFLLTALGTPAHGNLGILATVSFTALMAGTSPLNLNNVTLFDTGIPSNPLPIDRIRNGTVTVTSAIVPLPTTLGLFAVALPFLFGRGARRSDRSR